MSFTILKSALTKPSTRRYPFVKRPFFERTRGKIRIDIDKCIHCSLCVRRCPTDCLTVTKEPEKTWTINRMQCCMCTACVDVCPTKCLSSENQYSESSTQKTIETFRHA